MKIGIIGPMDIKSINIQIKEELPEAYSFPLISHLINGLLEQGHEVIAYTTSSKIEKPLVYKTDNVTICIGPSGKHPGRRFFNKEIKILTELINSNPPDIIHAHWSYEFAWAAINSGIPHVVTLHDVASVILRNQFDPYRIVRWYMNLVTLSKAKHLIANSNYTFNTLTKKERQKTTIINNFYPQELDEISFSKKKGNYIITVSNAFDKRKNISESLKAFSIIKEYFPHLQYYLVGNEMGLGGAAYKYAVKNNLHYGVKFMGSKNHEDIITLIKDAVLMVHPAKEESFGMTVLESMVLGTPVVGGSASGNIPYLLRHKETGLVCDITDPGKIGASIKKLLIDKNLYERLQKNARKYAVQEFSESVTVNRHLELYRSILQKERIFSLPQRGKTVDPVKININIK
jgi:L-malate glycosyltransferase